MCLVLVRGFDCDLMLCNIVLCFIYKDVICRVNICGKCEVEFFDKNGRKVDCKYWSCERVIRFRYLVCYCIIRWSVVYYCSVMVIVIKGSDGFEFFKYCLFEIRINNF